MSWFLTVLLLNQPFNMSSKLCWSISSYAKFMYCSSGLAKRSFALCPEEFWRVGICWIPIRSFMMSLTSLTSLLISFTWVSNKGTHWVTHCCWRVNNARRSPCIQAWDAKGLFYSSSFNIMFYFSIHVGLYWDGLLSVWH